ncbi:Pentatricopeptide repeat [Macleaya cordata]|uniref:Pentatricopeptide repeat n=1 Tax=Macleaya cordata TaxID=56857 RepID=A0A200Q5Q8_MACCD|nr:Pentatricopeptide repeat [Macleaya cordata]
MRQLGVLPDPYSYSLLLKLLSRSKTENPNQIHAQSFKFGFSSDSFVQNSLLSAYSNGGYLGFACQVFDEIYQRDLVSWTAMIDGYVKNNQPNQGLDCFMKMRLMNVEVDEVTIVSVLSAAGMVGSLWLGKCVHGFYTEPGRVKWDVYVGAALLNMYAKCGCCDEAHKVFNEMSIRNVVSWSSLISSYLHCSRVKEALNVFQDMLIKQVKPNEATLSSVLTACAQLGALDQGRWVHTYIKKSNLNMNSILATALIDMYAKCGSIDEAFAVFENLPKKDVYPWTVMINGLAMHGHSSSSLKVFAQMLMSGVRPNEVTFIGILCACSHGGLVDEGIRLFDSMDRIFGIKPNVDHYGCMVDLLGRAARLNEALNLIERMPTEPSAGVWGALLGACMIHKDFDLGEQIGKRLIELQPSWSGRYMRLANLYSVCGRWEEAALVRKLMKEKGVEKIAGCSFIEVDGSIHEFIAWDKSHLQSKDIYVMLDAINPHLKLTRNVPDIFSLENG